MTHRLSTMVIRVATRVLPAGPVRERYRREFLAEMATSRGRAQLQFAVGILSSIIALRVALAGSALLVGPVDPPAFPERRRPWLCRLRMHRFVGCHNPDGDFYLRCRRCGVDHYELVPVKNGNVIGNLFSQFPA